MLLIKLQTEHYVTYKQKDYHSSLLNNLIWKMPIFNQVETFSFCYLKLDNQKNRDFDTMFV